MSPLLAIASQKPESNAPVPGVEDTFYAKNASLGNVRFVFSKNPELIQQFTQMRKELYAQDPRFIGFRDFHHMEYLEYFSAHDHIQLIFDGDKCIGGGRLTLVKPGDTHLLPLEMDLNEDTSEIPPHYQLRYMLPELYLAKESFVEASRMLVHPDYRGDMRYISQMFVNLYEKARELNARYFFAMTDKLRCRMYRKIATVSIGKHATLLDHIHIPDRPDFEGVKMQIMVWDTTDLYVKAFAPRYGIPKGFAAT